ncbi:MAG: hypothetical protein KatS3mg015_0552 [Fimbriimonadales bacterium]|nr:MAG: hypothetical protein KatS3mg015_0552 [Fimbriimonadales bacterium]
MTVLLFRSFVHRSIASLACAGILIPCFAQVNPVFAFGRSVGTLYNMAIDASGSKIATTNYPGVPSVKLWRTSDLAFLGRAAGFQSGTAFGVAFSPSGDQIAFVGENPIGLRLQDVWTGQTLWQTPMYTGRTVAFHPNGGKVYAGGLFGACLELRVTDGSILRDFSVGTSTTVSHVQVSPNGRLLAIGYSVGSVEGRARVIDLDTGVVVADLGPYGRNVGHIRFVSDGSYLLVAESTDAGRVIVVRTSDWTPTATFAAHAGGTWTLAPLSGRNEVLTAGADQVVRRWTLSGSLVSTYPGHQPYTSMVVASPDGNRFYTGGPDGRLVCRSVDSGAIIKEAIGHTTAVGGTDLSPDQTLVAAGGDSSHPDIFVWNATTGDLIFRLSGHSSTVFSIEFSPNGSLIASGSADRTVKIWSAATGALLHDIALDRSVEVVTFHPGGNILATGGPSSGVALIDPVSGIVTRILSDAGSPNSLRFSPDGSLLAVGTLNAIRVYNTSTWDLIVSLPGVSGTVQGLSFTPDGTHLFSATRFTGELKKWRVSDWTLEWTRQYDPFFTCIVVNDGANVFLVSKTNASGTSTGALVDADDGSLLFEFSNRLLRPFAVGAHRNQSRIAISSLDQTATVLYCPTAVPWETLTVTRGVLQGGDLASLLRSDDDRLQIEARRPTEIAAASAEIEVSATLPLDRRNGLSLLIETASTSEPVIERLEMFNAVTGQWETIAEWPSGADDVSRTINVKNPQQYIDLLTGQVRVRLGFHDRGVTAANWNARVDMLLIIAS